MSRREATTKDNQVAKQISHSTTKYQMSEQSDNRIQEEEQRPQTDRNLLPPPQAITVSFPKIHTTSVQSNHQIPPSHPIPSNERYTPVFLNVPVEEFHKTWPPPLDNQRSHTQEQNILKNLYNPKRHPPQLPGGEPGGEMNDIMVKVSYPCSQLVLVSMRGNHKLSTKKIGLYNLKINIEDKYF